MTNIDYPLIKAGQGSRILTIEGNYHKIIGLNQPIVTYCNGSTISISNLTVSNMELNNTSDTWGYSSGAGFIGTIDYGNITLMNCNIVDSVISAVDWAGGLYGYFAAGAPSNYVNVSNCSVKDCNIIGKHAGGIAGFGNGNSSGTLAFSDCYVSDCTIEANSNNYGGAAFGTFGSGPSVTFTNASFSNNTVTNQSGDRSDILAYMNDAKTVSFDNQTYTIGSEPFTFEEVGFIQGADGGYYSNPSIVPQSYTISFDVLPSSENITATEGQPVSLPALPVMEGYKAVGWTYNGTLVGYMFTVTDSDVTLIALYEEIPADDGNTGGMPMFPSAPSQTVTEEASLGTDDIVVIAMCVIALLVLGFLFFIIKTS